MSSVNQQRYERGKVEDGKDIEKEYASLWLAVEELNKLDAEKELALQELLGDREEALAQRDAALLLVEQLRNEYRELQLDIEVKCYY